MINLVVDGFFICLFLVVFITLVSYNIDQTTKYRKK